MNSKQKRRLKKKWKRAWHRRFKMCTSAANKIGLAIVYKTALPSANFDIWDPNQLFWLKRGAFDVLADGDFFAMEEFVERVAKISAFV